MVSIQVNLGSGFGLKLALHSGLGLGLKREMGFELRVGVRF